ncbi:hypothetical protein PENTCL1PPCAC_12172, partial [Pristionchus entomophagus]
AAKCTEPWSAFCWKHYSTTTRAEADLAQTYRDVLTRHPEWKARFKRWTQEGTAGNAVADLGRSLPDVPIRARIQYTLY